MPNAPTLFPPSDLTRPTSGPGAWLPRMRHALIGDDNEGFLCEAVDLADLERRLRRLESGRADRFGPLPRVP